MVLDVNELGKFGDKIIPSHVIDYLAKVATSQLSVIKSFTAS